MENKQMEEYEEEVCENCSRPKVEHNVDNFSCLSKPGKKWKGGFSSSVEEELENEEITGIMPEETEEKEDGLEEFTKNILGKGGYVTGEKFTGTQVKTQAVPGKIAPLKSKKAPIINLIQKEEVEKEIGQELKEQIKNGQMLIENEFNRHPRDIEIAKAGIQDFLKEKIKVLNEELMEKRGTIAIDNKEEVRQYLDGVCNIHFKLLRQFSPDRIKQLKNILWEIKNDFFKNYELIFSESEKIKKASERISKRLSNDREFEDFFQKQMKNRIFDKQKAMGKIKGIIEDEVNKSWQNPLPINISKILNNVDISEQHLITAKLFTMVKKEKLAKLGVVGI